MYQDKETHSSGTFCLFRCQHQWDEVEWIKGENEQRKVVWRRWTTVKLSSVSLSSFPNQHPVETSLLSSAKTTERNPNPEISVCYWPCVGEEDNGPAVRKQTNRWQFRFFLEENGHKYEFRHEPSHHKKQGDNPVTADAPELTYSQHGCGGSGLAFSFKFWPNAQRAF